MPRVFSRVPLPANAPTQPEPSADQAVAHSQPPPAMDPFSFDEEEEPPPSNRNPLPDAPPSSVQAQRHPVVDGLFSVNELQVKARRIKWPLHLLSMLDRRPAAPAQQMWVLQSELEHILYRSNNTTGAFYRLIQRTPGAAGKALCLRRSSINYEGMITSSEWELMGVTSRLRPRGCAQLDSHPQGGSN